MTIEKIIHDKLVKAFQPELLQIINDSDKHMNHPGSPNSGASHFRIKMIAEAFKDKSRIEKHRLVYAALEDDIKSGVHAIQLDLS
jgi:BolA protein